MKNTVKNFLKGLNLVKEVYNLIKIGLIILVLGTIEGIVNLLLTIPLIKGLETIQLLNQLVNWIIKGYYLLLVAKFGLPLLIDILKSKPVQYLRIKLVEKYKLYKKNKGVIYDAETVEE